MLDIRFDGDTSSANVVYSMEAKAEVSDFLKKRKAYVGADGKFLYEVDTDTVKIVLANCTGNPIVTEHIQYRDKTDPVITYRAKEYSLNKILEQLIKGNTQPLLYKYIEDQIPQIQNLDDNRLQTVDDTIPVICIQENDKISLLDGQYRAAKGYRLNNRKWCTAHYITPEILEKAKI